LLVGNFDDGVGMDQLMTEVKDEYGLQAGEKFEIVRDKAEEHRRIFRSQAMAHPVLDLHSFMNHTKSIVKPITL
jgi:hypothetical protein